MEEYAKNVTEVILCADSDDGDSAHRCASGYADHGFAEDGPYAFSETADGQIESNANTSRT
jgi:hypothetical protein